MQNVLFNRCFAKFCSVMLAQIQSYCTWEGSGGQGRGHRNESRFMPVWHLNFGLKFFSSNFIIHVIFKTPISIKGQRWWKRTNSGTILQTSLPAGSWRPDCSRRKTLQNGLQGKYQVCFNLCWAAGSLVQIWLDLRIFIHLKLPRKWEF